MQKEKFKNYYISDIYFYQEGPGVRKWQFRESGVKLLNVGNINNGKIDLSSTKINISEDEAYGKYSHFLIDEGDLLIACSGIVVENFHNKIAFVNKENLPLCLNTSTMRFKQLPEKKGELIYLKYFLQTDLFKEQLTKLITGSAQLNFGPSHIRKIQIPLPDLPTQQKIAAILDKADELRQYNQQLIEKYDALTQSLFLDMFGDIDINVKFPIGIIDDLIEIVRDGPHVSPKYSENGIPILSTRNIRPFELINEEIKYVSKETYTELTKRFKPQKGDVLLTKGGTTGFAKIVDWDWDFCIWVHLAALRVKNDVSPKYIEFALNSYYGYNQSQEHTRGIANKDLGLKRIVKIKLPIPPIDLQNTFADRIILIEAQKQQAQEALVKSEQLFQGLLQQAFNGELS